MRNRSTWSSPSSDSVVVERAAGIVGPVLAVVELAGDEDLVAVEPGRADRLADAGLVAVPLGGVDMAVADLERARDRLGGLAGVDLEDAEAELRDRVAVVERDVGDAHEPSCALAASATASGVKPNCCCRSLSGADAPKVRMRDHGAGRADVAVPAEVGRLLDARRAR